MKYGTKETVRTTPDLKGLCIEWIATGCQGKFEHRGLSMDDDMYNYFLERAAELRPLGISCAVTKSVIVFSRL